MRRLILTQADDEQALVRVAGKWSAEFDTAIGSGDAICDPARNWKD